MNLHDLKFSNGFLDMILKAQATKEKIGKLDLHKLKLLCFRGRYQCVKRQPTAWGKYLQIICVISIQNTYRITIQQQKNKQPS